MPPLDADAQPSDAERASAAAWIRSSLKTYETEHAGEPGRVTVRRLTSAEYAYAIRDLTGIDIKVGIDASSDSVGGEGFANFGDVQFVHDESIERYLEAAKQVADHAVIGAGPVEFYADPGDRSRALGVEPHQRALRDERLSRRVRRGRAALRPRAVREGALRGVVLQAPRGARRSVRDGARTCGQGGDYRTVCRSRLDRGEQAEHRVSDPRDGKPLGEACAADCRRPSLAREGPRRLRRDSDVPDDLAQLVFRARQSRRRRCRRRKSARIRRRDIESRDDASVRVRVGISRRTRSRRSLDSGRAAGAHPFHRRGAGLEREAGRHLAQSASRRAHASSRTRCARHRRRPGSPARGGGRGAGAVLSTRSLRSALSPDGAATLQFGTSPDGTPIGPDDFATSGAVSFTIDVPPGGNVVEFQAEAELGRDRNAVVRVMLSDRPEGASRDARQRVVFGDPQSAGYKAFRGNMAEYVALLPPNSHGEADPADKDPVPAPFDNTYNSPEHDAFVLKVKYQRSDRFFTENMVDGRDRVRLNQAWNDLFGSWPYHDAYLGMLLDHYGLQLKSRRAADLDTSQIAAQPADARPHLTSLRAHYDEVMKAQTLAQPGHVADAIEFASRAWRRPLTTPEKAALRAFYQKSRTATQLDHDGAMRALLARILLSPAFLYRVEGVALGPEKPLTGWELASRLSFFLWSSIPDDELRRAAAAGELGDPVKLARQVKRMTADPKARRVATEFFGQWLGFYQFDHYRGVDTSRFPEFTDEVRSSMYDEAISTFEYIVSQNRPVKEILDADYMFLNKPLAAFYGIEKDVKSTDRVVRIDGARVFNRGGALRLGSVLTTTSAPLRTSPSSGGTGCCGRYWGRRRHRHQVMPARSRGMRNVQRSDAARAAGRAQAQRLLRGLSPANRPAGLSAGALRSGRPHPRHLRRRQAHRRHG